MVWIGRNSASGMSRHSRARQGGIGGQAKSNPKDARVIADQLRLRSSDFRPIALEDEAQTELRLMVSRRGDPTSTFGWTSFSF
jgi:hypothetical protein